MKNQQLEEMLNQIKANPEQGFSKEFIELVDRTNFEVPAILPKDTDPKVIRQIVTSKGINLRLPEGANPQPCLLENQNGEKFLPVFTTREQLDKGGENAPKFPLTLNIPFKDCIKLLQQNPSVKGAVINPFTHNLVVPVNQTPAEKKKEVTIDEYHVLMRQKFEAQILPAHLFQEKGELAKKINKEKGELIKELYEEAYDGEIACPYVPDDFDFMAMQITDTLLVVQIMMPKKYKYQSTASSVIYAWDDEKEKIWYYAIIKPNQKATALLVEKMEDGQAVTYGEVPEESGILSKVIDLIQEKE